MTDTDTGTILYRLTVIKLLAAILWRSIHRGADFSDAGIRAAWLDETKKHRSLLTEVRKDWS